MHTKRAVLSKAMGGGRQAPSPLQLDPIDAGFRLYLLKKALTRGLKFFAGFKESLRSPGPLGRTESHIHRQDICRDSEASIYGFVCHGYIINQPNPQQAFSKMF